MKNIQLYILDECKILISKYEYRVRYKKYYANNFEKRTGVKAKPPIQCIPNYWSDNNHFNPYYVRSKAKIIAHAVTKNIRSGDYKPDKSIEINIDKISSGFRKINIFAVQDKAVAKYLTNRLENRYTHLLSSYTYAYRKDKNAHHAIEHLNRYIKNKKRLYFIKIDFKNYFDNISHDYIIDKLQNDFGISYQEKQLVLSFIQSSYVKGEKNYNRSKIFIRKNGLPQGNCLSNFLSNLASWEMDRELELTGACLARYADDCIILCKDYITAYKAMNIFLENKKRSSVTINFEKSIGIRLFTQEPSPELPCITEFDFLGHKFIENGISISDKSIHNMKKKMSKIIYRVLLKYLKRDLFSAKRINSNGVDLDMIDCIKELRHYIYGKLSEKQLSSAINNSNIKLVFSSCALSYYPLVNNPKVFYELDGWLLDMLFKTQKYRNKLIQKIQHQLPLRQYTRDEFISGTWNPNKVDVCKLPSFYRSWQYTRKCLKVYGLVKFPSPTYS